MSWTRIVVVTFLVSSCTTYSSHTGLIQKSLADEDYEAAALSLDRSRKGPNRLLYLLENGLVAHYRGHYDRSNRYFEAAERLADRLYTKSLFRELVSFVTNDAIRAYRGETFEFVFIHYYRSLNYWFLGLPEDALVECRKANLKLARYTSDPEVDLTYRNDAFIQYLTGLFYEATGEWNDARVSYDDALQAYEGYDRSFGIPAPPDLESDRSRVMDELEMDQWPPVRFASVESSGPSSGQLVIFAELGFVPQKVQEEIQLPIYDEDFKERRKGRIRSVSNRVARRYRQPHTHHGEVKYWLRAALPAYRVVQPQTAEVSIRSGSARSRTAPAENLSEIALRTHEDKRGTILARTIARGLTKYVATQKIRAQNKVLGFFANIFSAFTEVADTRSWTSLPHSIQIGRLQLSPGLHDVVAEALDRRGRVIATRTFEDVQIRDGEFTFLNFRVYR